MGAHYPSNINRQGQYDGYSRRKKLVILPLARPGDTFDVQLAGEGKLILTRLESGAFNPAQVRIEKRGTFSVGVLDHPINDEALNAALADFP